MRFTLYFLITIALIFSSCRKEIDLKLKDTEPQYVIVGVITAGDSLHFVEISKTVSFSAENNFPKVSGAQVVVMDNFGNSFSFLETEPGRYENTTKDFVEGRTYTLQVNDQGKTFQAISTIPKIVPLLGMQFLPNQFFGEDGFIIVPTYKDESNVRNFYTFQYVDINDSKRFTNLIIRDDEFSDGQFNQQPLFEGFAVNSGDTIGLEMCGIDLAVYNYYFSKIQNTDPNSGAPANPVSNWNNDALGYFAARNIQQTIAIVP
ncbi:MAG: DUF4249 domain-containing protein [Bacteroidetes bacterium]|nr:DUF4249 domain-containing protein [Bacteroidota bacterium]